MRLVSYREYHAGRGTYTAFLLRHFPPADYLIACILELFHMHRDDVLAEDGDGIEESNEFLNLPSHLAQCIRALNQTGKIRV